MTQVNLDPQLVVLIPCSAVATVPSPTRPGGTVVETSPLAQVTAPNPDRRVSTLLELLDSVGKILDGHRRLDREHRTTSACWVREELEHLYDRAVELSGAHRSWDVDMIGDYFAATLRRIVDDLTQQRALRDDLIVDASGSFLSTVQASLARALAFVAPHLVPA